MKIGKLAKQILGGVAPMLGTALGGPLGGMAGKFLADKLGVDPSDLDKVITHADPAQLESIQKANADFKVEMKKLDISEAQLHAADRSDARTMGRERGTAFQMMLSIVFLFGYFGLIYIFITGTSTVDGMNEWSKGQLGVLIGILTAAVPQILAYWFGSSSGSKEKTALLNGS